MALTVRFDMRGDAAVSLFSALPPIVFTLHEASKTLADEVLLDGASWPKGLAILKAHAWPKVDVKWGLRSFAVLEAFDDAAPKRWWWPWH